MASGSRRTINGEVNKILHNLKGKGKEVGMSMWKELVAQERREANC